MAAGSSTTTRSQDAVVERLESGDGTPWWSVLPPHRIGWEPYLHLVWERES